MTNPINLTDQDITNSIATSIGHYIPKHPVPSDFVSQFSPRHFGKGQQVLNIGERWKHFGIIVRGIFRLYYLDRNGQQHTKGIFTENQFLAPCAPAAINHPVNFCIESFEESCLLVAPYHHCRSYLEQSQWGQTLLLRMLEGLLDDKVAREFAWLNLDAESRYAQFIEQHPQLNQRLPLFLIANYLGMTDVTLSRIRKKLGMT